MEAAAVLAAAEARRLRSKRFDRMSISETRKAQALRNGGVRAEVGRRQHRAPCGLETNRCLNLEGHPKREQSRPVACGTGHLLAHRLDDPIDSAFSLIDEDRAHLHGRSHLRHRWVRRSFCRRWCRWMDRGGSFELPTGVWRSRAYNGARESGALTMGPARAVCCAREKCVRSVGPAARGYRTPPRAMCEKDDIGPGVRIQGLTDRYSRVARRLPR